MNIPPTIAAIVPSYNRAHCVGYAIDSILAQTHPCDEIIVVDDGSTDNTPDVLAAYGDAIRVIRQENAGVSAARNAGIRAATSDWIAFLDSDDIWKPEKVAIQREFLRPDTTVLVATNWAYETNRHSAAFDDLQLDGQHRVLTDPLLHLCRDPGHRLWLPTWAVRRAALLRVNGFDARMRIGEDNRLLFQLAYLGTFVLIPEVLTIRISRFDDAQLTRLDDSKYHSAVSPLMVEILAENYFRAGQSSSAAASALRGKLAKAMRVEAVVAARDRSYGLARRRAIESIAFAPSIGHIGRTIGVAIAPRLVGLWSRRKYSAQNKGLV
jgi:glycosyltransferase involved in cell wall biosynthesis